MMGPGDVLAVLDAHGQAGVASWLDGGWKVDALLGNQTRPHEDVDLVVELGALADVQYAFSRLGFYLVEDYLPIPAVMRNRGGKAIDLHLQLDHHQGYEPRERDRVDVAALAVTFSLEIPPLYKSSPAPTETPV